MKTPLISFTVMLTTCFAAQAWCGQPPATMPLAERARLAEVIVLGQITALRPQPESAPDKPAGSVATVKSKELLTGGQLAEPFEVFVPQPLAAELAVGQSSVWLLIRRAEGEQLSVPMRGFVLPEVDLADVRAAMEESPLHVVLSLDKGDYTLPADVTVTLSFTNRGTPDLVLLNPYGPQIDNPVSVGEEGEKKKTEYVLIEFSKFDKLQDQPILRPFAVVQTRFPVPPMTMAPRVTLKHNESFSVSVNLAEKFKYQVKEAGRLSARFIYDTSKPQPDSEPHWNGVALSNRVWFSAQAPAE